jgi:hypothetical protein
MNQVNLIFVDENNHNKYYNMTELGNGKFKAEWGRVGSGGQSMEYWMSVWDNKLHSKLSKGGVDLKNDEYVIYDSARCTIRYLIEVKK